MSWLHNPGVWIAAGLAAILVALALPAYAALPAPGEAGAPNDLLYMGEPARNADGTIKRSSTVRAAFVKVFPCPATMLPGPCPGWSVDHVRPLACGYADQKENMQWLPNAIKSAAGALPKDRWEMKVYCRPRQLVVLP